MQACTKEIQVHHCQNTQPRLVIFSIFLSFLSFRPSEKIKRITRINDICMVSRCVPCLLDNSAGGGYPPPAPPPVPRRKINNKYILSILLIIYKVYAVLLKSFAGVGPGQNIGQALDPTQESWKSGTSTRSDGRIQGGRGQALVLRWESVRWHN